MNTEIFFEGEAFIHFIQTQQYSQLFLLSDANTHGFCVPVLRKSLPFFKQSNQIVIPQGEFNKNLSTVEFIWSELERYQADRKSLLVNLGGGTVSDMGGFAGFCL